MNCLETQSKIVAFIEDKLSDDETVEFVRHIRSCNNCAEELEIYYTLLVGMKQLDEDQELSSNFKECMEEKLNLDYKRVKNRRRVKGSTAFIISAAILIIGFFGFESYKSAQYQIQQEAIKQAQSEFYYEDYFGEAMFHTSDYEMFHFEEYVVEETKEVTPLYYERLSTYLDRHPEIIPPNPEEE